MLLELEDPYMAFPVVGMYGGFYFRLKGQGANTKLMVESWSRVVMGSGQRQSDQPSWSASSLRKALFDGKWLPSHRGHSQSRWNRLCATRPTAPY